MFRKKHPRERNGSEYYIEVVSMGRVEVERRWAVVAQEPSLADMTRREAQEVAVRTCTE
jgi:hypothetical protein